MTGKTSNRSGKGNAKAQANKQTKALPRTIATVHMDSATNLSADGGSAAELAVPSLPETTVLKVNDTDASAVADLEAKIMFLTEQLDATTRQLSERTESYERKAAAMQSLERELQARIATSVKSLEEVSASHDEAKGHVQRLAEDRERVMEHLSEAEDRIEQLNAALVRERNERANTESRLEESREKWQDTIQEIESQLHQATMDRIKAVWRAECLEEELRDVKTYIVDLELKIASMTALPSMDAAESVFLLGRDPMQPQTNSCLSDLHLDAASLLLAHARTAPLLLTASTTSLINASGSLPTPTSPGLGPVHATLSHTNGYSTFTSTTDHINRLNGGASPTPTQGTVAALQVQIREQSQVIGELQTLVRDLEREVCKARLGSAAQADLHLEYLKNVLVKYYTPGEEQYRDLFFNVVAHILKLSEDERELVRNGMDGEHAGVSGAASGKSRGWFGIF
ncbi:hypothetical protein BCR44DRAFT_1423057 [Catenaria anguillulae PL171]|uniref:GRIP domain-containing protein n=1 Tax=Catenaria anguillulae PL171 TaxID=765915 RepID=A0A1Y2I3X2_9FUNG|nr:hypothetical protein BCR44DRAFT_1423057 [Catenaria anguillulae PL171]